MATLPALSTAGTGPSSRRRKRSVALAPCSRSSAGCESRRSRPAGGLPQDFASIRHCGSNREFRDTQSSGVPKVPKARSAPFWHFWHLVILGFSEKTGSRAQQRRSDYFLVRVSQESKFRNDTRDRDRRRRCILFWVVPVKFCNLAAR